MKKIYLGFACVFTALLLAGCQPDPHNAEVAELRRQVSDLQQQITELQRNASADGTAAPPQSTPDASAPAPEQGSSAASGTAAGIPEELTTLVDGYVAEADALIAGGAASDLEQFFSAKQKASEIDRTLDRYEDELEKQVRDGSLSPEDYRTLEHELERLEDRLDSAEDELEYFFGIDD